MTTDARVILWGRDIAAVTWVNDRNTAVVQYDPDFIRSGFEVSPLMMPLRQGVFEFPALARDSFYGLPGLLSESLPDKFGNALIDTWLARQGRTSASFNPVERLCYIGRRGMGALEFEPTLSHSPDSNRPIEVAALVQLANDVLSERKRLSGSLEGTDDTQAIQDILRVGTSAGGARAKAVLAWNETTGEFRSGQVTSEEGFHHWLMKFDGVSGNKDRELADPQGYGRIEFAYYQMATDAGIEMSPCRLHHENGRAHFMTRRFDRTESGRKLHMQSLASMMHYDFNQPSAYAYEQAMQVLLRLKLPMADRSQQYRRAVFNVIARNQDDHVKNIAFLMDRDGVWRLSPAYDVVYAYNPNGPWTGQHQMSIQGKRDHFERDDLVELAKTVGIKKRKAIQIGKEVQDSVSRWTSFSDSAEVPAAQANRIAKTFRAEIF